MELSKYQQGLVGKIISGKISDVPSFIWSEINLEKIVVNSENNVPLETFWEGESSYLVKDVTVKQLETNWFVKPDDVEEAHGNLQEFASLWDKLERAFLIKTSSVENRRGELFPIFTKEKKGDFYPICREVVNFDFEYRDKRFFPFSELKSFKKKGFRTNTELKEEQKIRREKAGFWIQFGLSFIAILMSAGTVFWVNQRGEENSRKKAFEASYLELTSSKSKWDVEARFFPNMQPDPIHLKEPIIRADLLYGPAVKKEIQKLNFDEKWETFSKGVDRVLFEMEREIGGTFGEKASEKVDPPGGHIEKEVSK